MQVAQQEGRLLDGRQQSLVHRLLVLRARAGHLLLLFDSRVSDLLQRKHSKSTTYLGLLSLLEEGLLALRLAVLLVLGEVALLADLVDDLGVNAGKVDLLAGRDHIASVHPSEGNAVGLEGACDEQNALVKVSKEDDALAAETASEEDENGAGLKARAQLGRARSLASLWTYVSVSRSSVCVVREHPAHPYPARTTPQIARDLILRSASSFNLKMRVPAWPAGRPQRGSTWVRGPPPKAPSAGRYQTSWWCCRERRIPLPWWTF